MPLLVLALIFSMLTVAGSLYLSLGLGLLACPLCFYQRTFAFALVALLSMGLLLRLKPAQICQLALPLVLSGLGVAGFHTYLVIAGKLECPPGIAELGPAPLQSLIAYAVATLPILIAVLGESETRSKVLLFSLILAGLATYGSIVANPPAKAATAPTADWKQLKTCQVPYSS